jgi:hypothetical protein
MIYPGLLYSAMSVCFSQSGYTDKSARQEHTAIEEKAAIG